MIHRRLFFLTWDLRSNVTPFADSHGICALPPGGAVYPSNTRGDGEFPSVTSSQRICFPLVDLMEQSKCGIRHRGRKSKKHNIKYQVNVGSSAEAMLAVGPAHAMTAKRAELVEVWRWDVSSSMRSRTISPLTVRGYCSLLLLGYHIVFSLATRQRGFDQRHGASSGYHIHSIKRTHKCRGRKRHVLPDFASGPILPMNAYSACRRHSSYPHVHGVFCSAVVHDAVAYTQLESRVRAR